MQNPVIDALPTGGPADSPLLRNFLIKRMVFNLLSTEDPQDFEALDADTGAIPEVVQWSGTFFFLDLDDTTSDHDGVTVIRTADDYRYKIEDVDFRIRSVLSDTETDPPVSPSHGDAYLVPAGATGAWSSHQDDIAIFTRNGWRFEVPGIGKWLLIEDVDGFKRYTASGWLYGPGARSFDDDSIPLSAALGWGERIIVENQTTNTPPTATKGLRYIVGPSPTGAWLGKAKQIAICEVAGTWTFYNPSNGWAAYDKSASTGYTFNGTAWVASAGAWANFSYVKTTSGTTTGPTGSGNYSYSDTSAPTTATRGMTDDATLTKQAAKTGAILRFRYRCSFTGNGSSTTWTIGILRDSETTPVDWLPIVTSFTTGLFNGEFIIVAGDALSHTYKIRFWANSGSEVTSIARRQFSVEEATS